MPSGRMSSPSLCGCPSMRPSRQVGPTQSALPCEGSHFPVWDSGFTLTANSPVACKRTSCNFFLSPVCVGGRGCRCVQMCVYVWRARSQPQLLFLRTERWHILILPGEFLFTSVGWRSTSMDPSLFLSLFLRLQSDSIMLSIFLKITYFLYSTVIFVKIYL